MITWYTKGHHTEDKRRQQEVLFTFSILIAAWQQYMIIQIH